MCKELVQTRSSCSERKRTNRSKSKSKHIRLVSLEALRLRSHLAIPKLDISHRVTADDGAISENGNRPYDSVFALQPVESHSESSSPDSDNGTGGGNVEPADGGVGEPGDDVGFGGSGEMGRKARGRKRRFCERRQSQLRWRKKASKDETYHALCPSQTQPEVPTQATEREPCRDRQPRSLRRAQALRP